jgi:aminopeptidase N
MQYAIFKNTKSNHMLRVSMFFTVLLFAINIAAQDVEDIFNKGLVQFTLEDFNGCIETMNGIIKRDPRNSDAWHYKALSKFYLADYRGAQSDMKIAYKFGAKYKNKAFKIFLDEDYKRDLIIKQFYKKTKLYPELGYRPKYTRKDSLRGALRAERNCFDVNFYDLNLKIDPKKYFISGTNAVYFEVMQPTRRIQIDLFANYTIESITWNEQKLKFTREYDAIFIDFPVELIKGTKQIVTITYSGKPQKAANPPWDGGFVWKKDSKGNLWCGVACEHLGASSWWPNKDHATDEPDSMKMTFAVPTGYELISNGTLRSKEVLNSGYSKHTWFVANPINTYNVTFYLGKFVQFSDTIKNKNGKYPLDYYVLPENREKAAETFAQTKPLLEYYESAFGEFPFPQDGFALVESPYEGMEHQGAIAYGNEYNKLRRPEYLNRMDDYIIVHEAAHEWWGNSVTAADMSDIWLQEGFATYAELMFLEHKYGYKEYIKQLSNKLLYIFNIWPLVQNYDVNENAFASNDCYTKGAAILNNLRCIIDNDTLFFQIIRDFAVSNARKVVTSNDFVSFVNLKTGKNFTPFFNKFLKDKDLPVLKYTFQRKGPDLVLKYQWVDVEKGFTMPVCITTGKDDGIFRLIGTAEEQEIILPNATTVRFFTNWNENDKVLKNSLTYYWTRCANCD